MHMFMNYQNPYPDTPNNLYKAFPQKITSSKLDPIEASKPYETYNAKGELEGYFWNYGDSINLEFNLDGEITIESNALVFKKVGQDPALMNTPAKVGQRAYNVIDLRSWTCVAVDKRHFEWLEDREFEYMAGSDRSVYVSAEDYLRDKIITMKLYNFRFEEIYRDQIPGTTQAILHIDAELSKQMYKGIYYCSLEVTGIDTHQTIFAPQDCKLIVK